ncbi:prepilin-type N-terminal cleavage/methylation domain-containing protein [Lonsdalea quercina]|uniref:Prepilin peptidase dependent protein C n=1 Tax=Lonsdalea quercina TaxID=71657 RepID=A0A1H3WJF2_9GAMM|nr:prepilin-type N-terminal cleavage/methylation domain-containing protein [Lonsdalea quercina]SDZ86534.1 prepilin peptidase dependent protein C [Lonsdalea quercina]
MSFIKKLSFDGNQSGFSLLETLIAAVLFSVSLTGLLQYHLILQRSLQYQWQQRQAWRWVNEQLEAQDAGVPVQTVTASLPEGWTSSLNVQPYGPQCQRVTAAVVTPRHYSASLTRWLCYPLTETEEPISNTS